MRAPSSPGCRAGKRRPSCGCAGRRRSVATRPGPRRCGRLPRRTGRDGEAEALCRAVLSRDPDHAPAHLVLAFVQLARGALEAGFRTYEWRRRLPGWEAGRASEAPDWTGDDPAGRTILIREEQGLGDAIQFVRYARALRRRGARVIAACGPALRRLFSTMPDLEAVTGLDGAAPPHDAQAPLLSLPHLLGPEAGTTPASCPIWASSRPSRPAGAPGSPPGPCPAGLPGRPRLGGEPGIRTTRAARPASRRWRTCSTCRACRRWCCRPGRAAPISGRCRCRPIASISGPTSPISPTPRPRWRRSTS